MANNQLTFGITGSFGSGCTTLAGAICSLYGYNRISLTESIRNKWKERNEQRVAKGESPSRKELQNLGDDLRKENGNDFLAQEASRIGVDHSLLVFDGIRNPKEVEFFRNHYPNFFLFTVWSPQDERWERVKEDYNGDQNQFEEDDNRDKNGDVKFGQQVQLCVDQADLVLRNDERHNGSTAQRALEQKIKQYFELLNGETRRIPHLDEATMAVAYTFSLRSLCIKRQVGAAIVDYRGRLVASGFNENPEPLDPCVKKFGYCYKDSIQNDHLIKRIEIRPICPHCHEKVSSIKELDEGKKCPHCKKSFLKAYSPDRGMSFCTAMHAEQMALANAGRKDLENGTMYSTTFPCAQCAREIVYAGIKEVVYVEPYPDPVSERFLSDFGNVRTRMFEGVKARAYERVFSKVREENENIYSI